MDRWLYSVVDETVTNGRIKNLICMTDLGIKKQFIY